jgi:hypothetical protein
MTVEALWGRRKPLDGSRSEEIAARPADALAVQRVSLCSSFKGKFVGVYPTVIKELAGM